MNLLDKIIETFDGVIIEDNQWTVDGSKDKKYVVEWYPYEKKYSCSCLGYTYRRKCRHIPELSESFRKQLRGRAGVRKVRQWIANPRM